MTTNTCLSKRSTFGRCGTLRTSSSASGCRPSRSPSRATTAVSPRPSTLIQVTPPCPSLASASSMVATVLRFGPGAVEGGDVDRRHLGRRPLDQSAGRQPRLDAGRASPPREEGPHLLLPLLATHARFMLGEPPRYVKTAAYASFERHGIDAFTRPRIRGGRRHRPRLLSRAGRNLPELGRRSQPAHQRGLSRARSDSPALDVHHHAARPLRAAHVAQLRRDLRRGRDGARRVPRGQRPAARAERRARLPAGRPAARAGAAHGDERRSPRRRHRGRPGLRHPSAPRRERGVDHRSRGRAVRDVLSHGGRHVRPVRAERRPRRPPPLADRLAGGVRRGAAVQRDRDDAAAQPAAPRRVPAPPLVSRRPGAAGREGRVRRAGRARGRAGRVRPRPGRRLDELRRPRRARPRRARRLQPRVLPVEVRVARGAVTPLRARRPT